jgi:branched-chain amino acid transport system permease protein
MSALLKRRAPWIALALVLIALPYVFGSGGGRTTLSLMGIGIVFALSYNMLLGQTGLLSFGHAVYYGLGGFLAVHAMNWIGKGGWPIPLPLVPLVGGATGLLFGVVFGALSSRRAGTAFAMITLGLGELVAASSFILRDFFGGEEGISANRTRLARVFEVGFGPQIEVYFLIAAWTFLCLAAMRFIVGTPFGRMCNAVRENPERVEFVGYSTQRIRFQAFCLSGLFAGVAGGLAAIQFELMNASAVAAAQSGTVLLMTYVGGAGLFAGPVIGAVVITLLQVWLSDLTGAWMLYFGLLFILVVMYAPGGLAGLLLMHARPLAWGTWPRLVRPYLAALLPALLLLLGAVILVEVSHHLAVKAPGEGAKMKLLGFEFMANRPPPYVAALLLIGAGFALARLLWPRAAAAWSWSINPLAGMGPK